MTEGKKVPQTVSASKLALAARQARAGSADVPLVHSDPLAIVGMGPLIPISPTDFAPIGPVGSYDSTSTTSMRGRSSAPGIL